MSASMASLTDASIEGICGAERIWDFLLVFSFPRFLTVCSHHDTAESKQASKSKQAQQ
jgi:hypothetical protein